MHDSSGGRLRRLLAPRSASRLWSWTGRRPKFRNILGIACTGHGASIALVTRDGVVRGSVLDRWCGRKYSLMLCREEKESIFNPQNDVDRSINYLLTLDRKSPPTYVFEESIHDWSTWLLRGLGLTGADIDLVATSDSHFATCELRLGLQLQQWFPNAWVARGLEHHEIHQRQAFWQSGFDEAAVLTLDACGEQLERLGGRSLAGTIAIMDSTGRSEQVAEMYFPDSSPGVLYDVVNRHVGFQMGDEGKTMGLAPYGEPELLLQLEPFLRLHPDGRFDFIGYQRLGEILEDYVPRRRHGEPMTHRHENVAYAGQALLERIVTNAFAAALRLTGRRKLVYAGGVALNSVANEIAYRATRPSALYVAPNPGDTGHALGCALFGAYELAGWRAPLREVPDYIGPEYTIDELRQVASASGYPVAAAADPASELARFIANGYITARFDGPAEHGPRALGNRSILCDPRPAGMKDYLNAKVKHREGFRPFAPAVLEEEAPEWFDLDGRSAFMLRVVPARPERRDRIAATVHVDGSCRVQTVSPSDNRGFYDIIRAFKQLTGVPVVLNTSFNIAGKPIVETPQDAVNCFAETEIDILALGPFFLSKHPIETYRTPRPGHFA